MDGYIQKYPTVSLQGVFCASDEMMMGALEVLQVAHLTDLNGWFFSGDGQLEGLQMVLQGVAIADTQNSQFYGGPALQVAIAITQGVKSNGASIMRDNQTLTNITPEELSKTKQCVAKLLQTGLQL